VSFRSTRKRLDKIGQQIDSLPVDPAVVRVAFHTFRERGELPQDLRIARAVVFRITSGIGDKGWGEEGDEPAMIRAMMENPLRPADDVMDSLLRESLSDHETARDAARSILKDLRENGLDVTEPLFAKRGATLGLPDWGYVGMHLIGYPECLVIPPYEEQARRLFERFAQLRQWVPDPTRRWFDSLSAAAGLFREHGELPDEQVMREAVLADTELGCLQRHWLGQGDPEAMAAFDAVSGASGEERERAIERVQVGMRERSFGVGPIP